MKAVNPPEDVYHATLKPLVAAMAEKLPAPAVFIMDAAL
jgi:hypothetical protein